MGGRGGRGNFGSAGKSGGWKLPDFVGSEKQVSWAKDIAEAAFKNLDLMQSHIEKMVSQNGFRDDGSDAQDGYTIPAVKEVRKMLQSVFEQPEMKSAKNVIDRRTIFDRGSLEKVAKGIFRDGQKWDKNQKKWVKK